MSSTPMPSPLILEVDIQCESWRRDVDDVDALCARAVKEAANATDRVTNRTEVSVMLCDDDFIRALNRQYRNKDAPTNVLAFPLDGASSTALPGGPPNLLGDIVIAHGTVAREAADAGRSVDHHLCHMVVHGMLHLLGFDHVADAAAEEMEEMESQILARLGIADPYADDVPVDFRHQDNDVR